MIPVRLKGLLEEILGWGWVNLHVSEMRRVSSRSGPEVLVLAHFAVAE